MRRIVLFAPLLLLGCGTARVPRPEGGGWSCVPYARARTGIVLRGDAWQWWEAAEGRHARSRSPRPGRVLVFPRSARLPQGHVAVVSRVVSAREIRVDHANWASGRQKGREARDQPVLDASPGNDWTLVRVWYPPADAYGASTWPTLGFIHPEAA
ncbi:CHAP domain-containing protein [Roseicella aquatilis]|uniref:CHAP domain-containing protein n=1 Tax=Roseicella aquatilis TaxID=2527868 RepID=A0A4R4DW20_9PROT|nr:CHAP domain-containing protein [Roseicella aquatilis]TCZ66558.1 CHAP domain-containing protein [Roseicella aquatilis]